MKIQTGDDKRNMDRKRNHPVTKQRMAFIAAATLMGIFLVGSMLTSTLTLSSFLTASILQTAAADPPSTVTVGSGSGSILYRAHRMQDSRWDPCFAHTCNAGTGPGAGMWFNVYDSNLKWLGGGFANEDGTTINGLTIGATYYLFPEDCNQCHQSRHDVVFDHWGDNMSTQRQRSFVISAAQANADACYAFLRDGIRSTGPCSAGNSGGSQPPSSQPSSPPPSQSPSSPPPNQSPPSPPPNQSPPSQPSSNQPSSQPLIQLHTQILRLP